MSIKEIIQNALCDECSKNKYCDILADQKKCVFLEVKGERFTQQIISEIVGELEKLEIVLADIRVFGDADSKWVHTLVKSDVIETIKKMGEV